MEAGIRPPGGAGGLAADNLLELVLQSHGGVERWAQFSRFTASASITGGIWTMKGVAGLLDDVVLEGEIRDQRLIITPYPKRGNYSTWEPLRQTIETSQGVALHERMHPAAVVHRSGPADTVGRLPRCILREPRRTGTTSSPRSSSPARTSSSRTSVRRPRTARSGAGSSSPIPTASWAHCRQQTYYFDQAGCSGAWTTPWTSGAGVPQSLSLGVPRVRRNHGADPKNGVRAQPRRISAARLRLDRHRSGRCQLQLKLDRRHRIRRQRSRMTPSPHGSRSPPEASRRVPRAQVDGSGIAGDGGEDVDPRVSAKVVCMVPGSPHSAHADPTVKEAYRQLQAETDQLFSTILGYLGRRWTSNRVHPLHEALCE